MVLRKMSLKSIRAFGIVPLALMWGLTGCGSGGAEIDDNYQPALHWERFPINVAKGTMKLEVSTRRAMISNGQEDAIRRFAQQASAAGVGEMIVQRPESGVAADAVAGRVTQILVSEGIAPQAVVNLSYKAPRGSPVVVTFQRKMAVTTECGDWSENLAKTGQNTPAPNFGCAQQHNIAAVVANPEDFNTPRTMTSPDPMRRYQVFVDYRAPKSTETPASSTEDAAVAEVAK